MRGLIKKGITGLITLSLLSTAFTQCLFANTKVDISKPVELTWYFIGNGQQEDTGIVENKVNEYLKSKYKMNTTIKLKCFDWGTYPDYMESAITKKESFDICFTTYWANNYYDNIDRGAFIPLNNLWDDYAPKTKALIGEDFIAASKVKGISYAIPVNRSVGGQLGLILRKDLVEKYKIDTKKIKKIEDIEPYLEKVKKENPCILPLVVDEGTYTEFKSSYFDGIQDNREGKEYIGAISISSKDIKVFNELEKPETYAYFKTLHKFYKLGYMGDEFERNNTKECFAQLKFYSAYNTLGEEYIPVPIGTNSITSRNIIGSMQAISSTSKNPERALMFLELFNTDAYLNNLVNFGVEGNHYKKVNGKIIQPTANTEKYSPGTGWMFGNHYLNYIWDNEDPQKWEKHKLFDAGARKSKLLTFVFDDSKVQTEITNCNTILEKYMPMLEIGKLDPDIYLKKMLAELKKAGVDKIIAEEQRQIDVWKK